MQIKLNYLPPLMAGLPQVFHKRMPPEAIDLTSRLLQYSPSLRCAAVSLSDFFPPLPFNIFSSHLLIRQLTEEIAAAFFRTAARGVRPPVLRRAEGARRPSAQRPCSAPAVQLQTGGSFISRGFFMYGS